MKCEACRERGKTWEGDAPVCSFEDGGEFSEKGWNCGTANLIRGIVLEGQALPPWVDYQDCEDQKYAMVKVSEVGREKYLADALWVSWYKQRGRTDAMWLLDSEAPPRRPTEAECLEIVLWHRKALKAWKVGLKKQEA